MDVHSIQRQAIVQKIVILFYFKGQELFLRITKKMELILNQYGKITSAVDHRPLPRPNLANLHRHYSQSHRDFHRLRPSVHIEIDY